MQRLFDIDPLSGAVETFHYDENEDAAIIHRQSADLQRIVDLNKEHANHASYHRPNPGDMDIRLEARIPTDVAYLWLQKYGVKAWDKNHWPAVKRLLNDGEWRYLRTSNVIL